MDTEHFASSALPCIWAIEALARMKQVDISVLADLVVKTPEVADDVGKDVRDVLSLRLLEDFQVRQHGDVISSINNGPTPNIEIGQSTDHGDTLQFLLQKISVFSVTKEQSEALNSDHQTYIQNRRSSLPKCTLEQIKDAIQEGHPILEFLKKSSRLSTSDLATNITSPNNSLTNHEACSNAVPQKVKQRVHDGVEDVSMQGNLAISQSMTLQDPVKTDHISSRCKRIDPASKDKFPEHLNDILGPNNESDFHLHIAKKAKHDVSVEIKATDNLLVTLVSNEMSKNLVETGSKKTIVSKAKTLRSEKKDHDLCSGKNNCLKERDNDRSIRPSVSSLHEGTEKECVNDTETDGDNEGFDDEKIDNDIKRRRFPTSQCTFSEDILPTTQMTESTSLCIKCNSDGQLLVCSTRNCMKGVHPSCLGYAVSSDDCRHFYCPLCSYHNAISEYRKAMKDSSLARKSVVSSMRFANESRPTINGQYTPSCKQQCSTGKKKRRHNGNHPSANEHVRPECETEHNLCRELVVYVKQENAPSNEDIDKSSESFVSASNFCIQYRNKPREKK